MNCRKKMPVVPLNLNNFESSIISAGCPYVLTSPRSLRACKRAGIKPVELLYQSSSEIADNLGVHPKYVTDLFLQTETDRQRKLELCRKLRNEIIADDSLIKSLDLAHKDRLSCLTACTRGNRTLTSLRGRHHSSLLDHHHLKGLAENINHASSPSIMSNQSSHLTLTNFRETSQSPHSPSKNTSPTPRSKSTEYVPPNLRQPLDTRYYFQDRPESRYKNTQISGMSDSNSPTPRSRYRMELESVCRSRNSPSTPRSKSVPSFPSVPLVSTSSTPDYQPHSTDTVSTPRSRLSVCPHALLTESRLSQCTSELSPSPENFHNLRHADNYSPQCKTRMLKRRKLKVNKNRIDTVCEAELHCRANKKGTKNKQVVFEENLKKRKSNNTIRRGSDIKTNERNKSKNAVQRGKKFTQTGDSNESGSSKSSTQRKNLESLSSDKDSRQTGISKPKRKLNEHRKSKYGKSETDSAEDINAKKHQLLPYMTSNDRCESRMRETWTQKCCKQRRSTPKNSFYSSLRMNSMNISSHDLRILESLAMKREQDKANQELAHQVQQRWEADRVAKMKFENDLKNKWQKYIQEKRQLEKNINRLKMEEEKLSLQESQRILEDNLRIRDERVKRTLKQLECKRIADSVMRHEQLENKRAQTSATQNQKESLDALKKFNHIEKMDSKLEQAELNRRHLKDSLYKKITSGNRIKCLKHMSRMEELYANEAITRKQKLEECRRREERAWERYRNQVNSRLQQLQMNSAIRELRSDQVRSLARELEQGLERWQDQVMLLQWQAIQRAEAKANIQLEAKRLRTECENRERELQHRGRLRRVKAIEAEKERELREFIDAKESRIRALQLHREREITECRSAAQSTAELREHLRESLTPETFDRKVTKVAVEMRVGHRPSTASPTMMRSHIRLG